jgi:hypothetical protein
MTNPSFENKNSAQGVFVVKQKNVLNYFVPALLHFRSATCGLKDTTFLLG